MDNQTKTIIAIGSGLFIGKMGGSLAWWLLGGGVAYLILKSPSRRATIQREVSSAYKTFKARAS